jgi:hypothetical protein
MHSDCVTLSDWTAPSVALARDVNAFRTLLADRPTPAWALYFSHRIAGTDLEKEILPLAAGYGQALAAGRVVFVPNGTPASETDRLEVRGSSARVHGELGGGAGLYQAVRVKVREGPYRGLEGWTLPDLMQHEGPAIP